MESVEIRNITEDFKAAQSLMEDVLRKSKVSDVIASEVMLVFEALCHKIFEQRSGQDTVVTVTGHRRYGGSSIILSYEGRMFNSESESDSPDPEGRILAAYNDRIDYTYKNHLNRIRILARRSYVGTMTMNLLALFMATIVYVIIHNVFDSETELLIYEEFLYPTETLFGNALLMVGAPVTFLSLLKHLTETYVLSEINSHTRKIATQTVAYSGISVLMAMLVTVLFNKIIDYQLVSELFIGRIILRIRLGEFITEMMPSDIFSPFQAISPVPLILLAMIVTYSFCSIGKYSDKLMAAVNICYALFARMLNIIMDMMPFFAFCAVLDLLIDSGFIMLRDILLIVIVLTICLVMPLLHHIIRIAANGISVRGFISRLGPLLLENYRIASPIEAVPFNIRYCVKYYHLNRKNLEFSLPVLAQVNLNGNCYMITLLSLLFYTLSGSGLQPASMIFIGMLVFVMSLGAPNQPGSFIISMIIILHYLRSLIFLPLAILAEVFLGWMLNLINVSGDIVMVLANEKPDLSVK